MPKFQVQYKQKGKIQTQTYNVKTQSELENKLQSQHLFVLKITPQSSLKDKLFTLQTPKTKEILSAFYELKLGLKAHLPLNLLLENLQTHTKNPLLSSQFAKALFALNSGKSLSLSFKEAGFSDFICSMLEIGQKADMLEQAIEFILIELKNAHKNRKLLTKILLYPLLVSLVMIVVFLGITLFVLPQFEVLFANINAPLPLVSRSLLFMRTLVLDYGYFSFLGLCGIAFFIYRFYKTSQKFRCFMDRLWLRIPYLGAVLHYYQLSQFLLSFFWLYKSKVPLQTALDISSKALSNAEIKQKTERIFEAIVRGIPIAQAFRASGILDTLSIQLLCGAQNEEGFLESLEVLLELHQEELATHSETLLALIEPLMVLVLGALVLWLALAIFLPLWELPMQIQTL
ncbi:MAG: type II secretion system F family protein [Helicobacter sp.]|uniref:type II secretion system F family protein n=1 Tax=Helicobacter sp. TaxID=218 RepID=UPI0023D6F388|nr:type II secretion system F family protein [Helicobacter sp.]MDE5925162.1 type II secretion system F family protein [Helicobacter sp.]MDE7175281.1 type II secretion system F family protein [Helicobacter sp.]